jgi:hypothetical protein
MENEELKLLFFSLLFGLVVTGAIAAALLMVIAAL